MHSSISSSDGRLTPAPWGRIWLLTAVLALTALGGYECFWRSKGFVPSVNDDGSLWCYARGAVRADDPDQVVLLGASRIQLGINPADFAESFNGRTPVQLAVDGSSCIPTLDHLSRNPHFRGLVICGVLPWTFFNGIKTNEGAQAEFVRQYEQQSAAAGIEQMLRIWMQSHLVLRLPDVTPSRLVEQMRQSRMPSPTYLLTNADRSRLADYTQADIAGLRKFREQRVIEGGGGVGPEQYQRDLDALAGMVSRIQSRGGRVVFLFMPHSGVIRQVEEERFPRAAYWEPLLKRTGAIGIHFADYPSLQFDCPEGSHLDYRDARKFTRALGPILKAKLKG